MTSNDDQSLVPRRIIAVDGHDVMLRPLAKSDEVALGDYFLGLSAQTRRVYAPHPFDRETAAAICSELGTAKGDTFLRLVAEAEGSIVGYFILYLGLFEPDRSRRYAHLGPQFACSVGPSIADAWQGRGLGSELMACAMDCARRLGRKVMVLMGGVQERNARAVQFYSKCGFRKVGEFPTTITEDGETKQITNFDMAATL